MSLGLNLENSIPSLETEWKLWYQDTFDWETPRKVELAGRGLEQGLKALWERHLRERVTANGGEGFSRFSLYCIDNAISIEITESGGT